MKRRLQAVMQRILGFENYLFWFCRFKLATFRWESRKKEGDFRTFLQLLNPTDNVLDIGANIGLMTTLLARAVTKGRVIAIEPIPENFRTLQRIVRHYTFTNVVTRQIALGEEAGQLTMKMPVMEGVKMQGLAHVAHETIEGYEGASQFDFQVPVETLDQLDVISNMTIHAIKIDVENYEQFVLRGGRKMLQRDLPAIYCELWPNENRERVFELLVELGYGIHVYDGNKLVPFQVEVHRQHNFFFLPAGRTFPA